MDASGTQSATELDLDIYEEGEKESPPAPASKKFLGGQCVYAHDSDAYGLAYYFAKEKQVDFPGGAQPTECELQKWAQALQELHDENKVQWEIMDGTMRLALDSLDNNDFSLWTMNGGAKKCSLFSTSRKILIRFLLKHHATSFTSPNHRRFL